MTLTAIVLIVISAFAHAGWNMLIKHRNAGPGFMMAAMGVGAIALLPLLFYYRTHLEQIPTSVWWLLLATGIAQTFYNIALAAAYRNGDLSVAYPLARAMPVLMVGVISLLQSGFDALGHLALGGMALIVLGTFLLPMTRLSHWHLRQYINRGCLYALLAAIGTSAYSVIDSRALHVLRAQLPLSSTEVSLLYIALMSLSTALCFALSLMLWPGGRAQIRALASTPFKPILLVGCGTMFTYGLVLAAMLQVDDVSYVVAFRQLSIPIGVLLGLLLLREHVGLPRLLGVGLMFTGLVLVSVG